MKLTANCVTSGPRILFTCVQCGYEGSTHGTWFMTCPRCWVPMAGGNRETWWKIPEGLPRDSP